MSDTDKERFKKGVALAQTLFEGAEGSNVPMPKSLRDYTLRHVFGEVWQDPELSLQQRELITCSVLVALGREDEQRLHFVGARNVGISREEMEAMITHVAHYAGWPAAIGASKVLNDVWPKSQDSE